MSRAGVEGHPLTSDPSLTVAAVNRGLAAVGLVALVGGGLLTLGVFEDQPVAYLALTALGVAALAWLYHRPLDGAEGTVITVLLAIFLFAYLVRFYAALRLWFDGRLDLLTVLFGGRFIQRALTIDVLLESYAIMVGALAGLAVATTLVGNRPRPTPVAPPGHLAPPHDGRVGPGERVLLGIAVALSVATAAVHYVLLGLERQAPDLPLRLAGILALVRNVLTPSLGLLVVWSAERAGDRRFARLGVLFLVAHGLASGVLTSSRGQFVSPLVSLALLWLVTGRFSRRRAWSIVLASPLVAFVFAVLGAYRDLAGGDVEAVATGIVSVLASFASGDSVLPFWVTVLLAMVGRANGFDSLAHIIAWEGREGAGLEAWLHTGPQSVTMIFTLDIMAVAPESLTVVSPSLLGFFYYGTGSALATAACVALWTTAWCLLFRWLAHGDQPGGAVSFAVVAWSFVLLSNEGTLEGLPLFATFAAATLVLNHVVARALEPAPAGA